MPLSRRETLQRSAANLGEVNNAPIERFLAEIEFAEGLTDLVGTKTAASWPKLIDQAFAIVSAAIEDGLIDALEKAVDRAESLLAPIGKVAKTYTLHCAGHGHIDMNWMWSWPETVAVTNDTFMTVLKLMDEFDDFCYTQSQASVYEIIRRYNPAMFEQIKARVKQGRWEVAASHWVEGDKNIASGESLARHLLYTRRFMKEYMGLTPEDVTIDWSPDTFGHAITIPAIDARGGVKHYYMCRGGNWEKPPVFWYKSPDGSKILVNLETTWYNDHIAPHNAMAMLKFCKKTGLRDWLNVYGVGDHGGGPTRRDILRCYEMDGWPIYPTFTFATTREYYNILEKNGDKWPVIDKELNFEFTGCYTSQTQIKRNNRLGENYMVEAEIAASLATRILGHDYPAQALRDNWVEVLFSHFHDILPGSGVAETRQYNQGQFQNVAAAASMIKTQSLRAIAAAVDTSFAGSTVTTEDEFTPGRTSIAIGGGAGRNGWWGGLSHAGHVVDGPRPFVVFNPTAWDRTEVVQVTIWDAHTGPAGGELKDKAFVVRTADGTVIPAQKIKDGNYWGHRYLDLVFPVNIKSLGFTTYVVEEGTVDGFNAPVKCEEALLRQVSFAPGLPPLENEFLKVQFDSLTGGVKSLVDKASGRDLATSADPLGVLEYVLERPFGMSAWVFGPAQHVDKNLQAFSVLHKQSGPFQASVEAKLKVENSDVTVTYTLKAGQPILEIAIQVRWVEIGSEAKGTPALHMRFPMALSDAKGLYEVPFGAIERDLNSGEEVPALRWVDITGKAASGKGAMAGCAVANDSKYGYSLEGSTLRATLIRSSYDPDPIPEVGDHTIRFAVMPHAARPATADLVRLGASFNHPLQVVATVVHKGNLKTAAQIVTADPDGIVLTSMKKAEEDTGLVIRLQETTGKATTAKVTLSAALLGKVKDVVEVDLLERPVAKSTAAKTADGFSVKVIGSGIASVKVVFQK